MMTHLGAAAALAWLALLAVALVLVEGFPQQQAPGSSDDSKAAHGATYDEIVVETQLAVRPKAAAAAGLGLRAGRAKPVFFRPNVTSGAQTRRITPLAVATASPTTSPTTTSTTPNDGISFAARVVGVDNPLASAARARNVARSRRAPTASSASSSFSSSSSYRSSSASDHAGHPDGKGGGSSSGGASSSRTWSQQLADGKTVSVSAREEFEFAKGPHDNAPSGSRLLSLIVSGH